MKHDLPRPFCILGPPKSGKTSTLESVLGRDPQRSVAYAGTLPVSRLYRDTIEAHQLARPAGWTTFEIFERALAKSRGLATEKALDGPTEFDTVLIEGVCKLGLSLKMPSPEATWKLVREVLTEVVSPRHLRFLFVIEQQWETMRPPVQNDFKQYNEYFESISRGSISTGSRTTMEVVTAFESVIKGA